ncbi:flagellar hook-length control protein FliK [Pseudomonas brassicacearum]|uniref:Flagellar hook-length control protein FliK n=1 Tax=Pseudomonas brassicacearum TaxID=930166 RepID=A0AAJ3KVK5_9PSED|nr:flagellar hook-length control protein FliK [Pseudomonas brassicacearum]NUT81647.1 flagellar hook-length control protein FliK [Pseudomonas brassicacearum]
MDIIASFASSSAALPQADASSSPQGRAAESFASVLSQLGEAAASNDPTGSTVSTDDSRALAGTTVPATAPPAPTPTSSTINQALAPASHDAAAVQETELSTMLPGAVAQEAVLEPVQQPEPTRLPSPAVQPGQQVAAARAEQDALPTDDDPDLDIYATAGDLGENVEQDAMDGTDAHDSKLEDIRQRMDLIQSAGQLDPALLVVAPMGPQPVVALAVASQEVVSADPDTLVSPNTNLPTSNPVLENSESEAPVDTSVRMEVQGAVPELGGAVADALQDVRKQSDNMPVSGQVEGTVSGDVPGAFNLVLPALNSVGLSSADKVVANGLTLSAAIGTTDWQDGLGQQVIDMITRGEQQVDLKLNPAGLGPLSISLNLSDGNTQAQFQSAHASVRTAVEQALPQLREALASQGISLGQASVSDESSRQASGDQARHDAQGSRSGVNSLASAPSEDDAAVQSIVVRGSGVDLYV